jgi:DNA-binding XRE family transcriptional regulator
MNSELRARLERLGPIRVVSHDRAYSEELESIILRRTGKFGRRIDVAHRLFASGMSMKAALTAITELAEQDWTLCHIPIDGGIEELARDLLPLDTALSRQRRVEQPASFLAGVRARHKLSQREFAAALGLDVRTLQNWEQGPDVPDPAVLLLVALFDRDPAAVRDTLYAPVTLGETVAA